MDPGNWDIISTCFPSNFLPRFFASLLRKLLIPSNKKAELNLSLSVWLELGRLDSLTWDIWHHRYIIRNYSFPQFLCNLKTITVSTLKSVDFPTDITIFWLTLDSENVLRMAQNLKLKLWRPNNKPQETCESSEMRTHGKVWDENTFQNIECIENCEIKICHIPHCSACSSSETLAVEAMKLVWNFRYDENASRMAR